MLFSVHFLHWKKECSENIQISMWNIHKDAVICPKVWRHDDVALQWRHNEHDGVSSHQHRKCLLNRLFRHKSKKTSKLRASGLCVGNSPVTGEFPTQRASNAEDGSIWWRHHDTMELLPELPSLSLCWSLVESSHCVNVQLCWRDPCLDAIQRCHTVLIWQSWAKHAENQRSYRTMFFVYAAWYSVWVQWVPLLGEG